MTTEVAKAVEVAETAVEMTAPVVADGTLDTKKVAMYAVGTLAVAGCAYAVYRLIKKRKDDTPQEVITVNPEEVVPVEEPVMKEAPSAEKKKQKK